MVKFWKSLYVLFHKLISMCHILFWKEFCSQFVIYCILFLCSVCENSMSWFWNCGHLFDKLKFNRCPIWLCCFYPFWIFHIFTSVALRIMLVMNLPFDLSLLTWFLMISKLCPKIFNILSVLTLGFLVIFEYMILFQS